MTERSVQDRRMEAAAELFRQRGFQDANVRDIAAGAGCNRFVGLMVREMVDPHLPAGLFVREMGSPMMAVRSEAVQPLCRWLEPLAVEHAILSVVGAARTCDRRQGDVQSLRRW